MATRKKMSKSEAARLGGLARQAKYGDLGTPEGRRLGGLRSQLTHQRLGTYFKQLKEVRYPRYSNDLAELCGILAGDGHIDMYQVTVTTNMNTDMVHAEYIYSLFEKLFHVTPHMQRRSEKNTIIVVVSSKRISDFLVKIHMVRGNKVKVQLCPPQWIFKNDSYGRMFSRGLFDSDGCVYIDKHSINGKKYLNLGIAFTNRSLPLLSFFKSTLESHGLRPTKKSKYVVFLRREKDILMYFSIFGSSNPKHLEKMMKFFEQKYGGVPKWS